MGGFGSCENLQLSEILWMLFSSGAIVAKQKERLFRHCPIDLQPVYSTSIRELVCQKMLVEPMPSHIIIYFKFYGLPVCGPKRLPWVFSWETWAPHGVCGPCLEVWIYLHCEAVIGSASWWWLMLDEGMFEVIKEDRVWTKFFGEHSNFWKMFSLIQPRSMAHDWGWCLKSKSLYVYIYIFLFIHYTFSSTCHYTLYIVRCFDLFKTCIVAKTIHIWTWKPFIQFHELGMVSTLSQGSHVLR